MRKIHKSKNFKKISSLTSEYKILYSKPDSPLKEKKLESLNNILAKLIQKSIQKKRITRIRRINKNRNQKKKYLPVDLPKDAIFEGKQEWINIRIEEEDIIDEIKPRIDLVISKKLNLSRQF